MGGAGEKQVLCTSGDVAIHLQLPIHKYVTFNTAISHTNIHPCHPSPTLQMAIFACTMKSAL